MAHITKMLKGPLPFKKSSSSLFSIWGDFFYVKKNKLEIY